MAQAVDAAHEDWLHDCQYDYYGRRLATCSSDRAIKVWTQRDGGGWACVASWKAHYSAVWRLSWAHPEFGQLLASAGSDHNAIVWEEQEGVDDAGRVVSRWHKRAQLGDARDSVNDVKFAPRHLGLKLAAGSADGCVRVYEAGDLLSLAHWEFVDEFLAEPPPASGPAAGAGAQNAVTGPAGAGTGPASGGGGGAPGGVACLSWCTSPFDSPMMAVGGAASGVVRVWGYAAAARKWLPMLELAGHTAAGAAVPRSLPATGAVITGGPGVCDVSWAPNVGRSYHLIASAGRDGRLCLWRLQPEATADAAGTTTDSSGGGVAAGAGGGSQPAASPGGGDDKAAGPAATAGAGGGSGAAAAAGAGAASGTASAVRRLPGASADGALVAAFTDHGGAPVWRCDWNVAGTVLATAGDDGALVLRKQTLGGRWETVSALHTGGGGGGGGVAGGGTAGLGLAAASAAAAAAGTPGVARTVNFAAAASAGAGGASPPAIASARPGFVAAAFSGPGRG